jgi:hypothetical protein
MTPDTRDIPQSEKPPPIIPPCALYERIVGWFVRPVAEGSRVGRSPSATIQSRVADG